MEGAEGMGVGAGLGAGTKAGAGAEGIGAAGVGLEKPGRDWMALGGTEIVGAGAVRMASEREGAGGVDGKPGALADGKGEVRGVVTGAGRAAEPGPPTGIPDDEGVPGAGLAAGGIAPDWLRGIGALRVSGGRDGVGLAGVVTVGVVWIRGAAAVGTVVPGRVGGGSVWVIRSMGAAEGVEAGLWGDWEGTRPAVGAAAGRLGLSEPPPVAIGNGRAVKGSMPMRSVWPPGVRIGAGRTAEASCCRLRTDSGGRESWTGTVGRYTATSEGRPPEGLGRELAKDWAAAGLFTSRRSVRRISSRVCRWTSSRVIPLLMITVLLLPRMFTFWLPATWTFDSCTKRST